MVSFRGKKDQEAKELQARIAVSETGRAMKEEYVQSLGRSVYAIISPEVIKLLQKQKLEFLIPMVDHLNRMTQIGKDDVVIDRLDIEYIFLRVKCLMKESEYNRENSHLLETLQFFAMHIPTDAYEGFKAKLLAYSIKVLRTELEEKKTKGMFG